MGAGLGRRARGGRKQTWGDRLWELGLEAGLGRQSWQGGLGELGFVRLWRGGFERHGSEPRAERKQKQKC